METQLRPVINAAGTLTRLSAGPLAPGVIEAMAECDDFAVDMAALQAHASGKIAAATGAEAGIVCAGASAGLLLAAAAVIAGLDPHRMNALPLTNSPNEIIVARSQRNGYDHALRAGGARLVEVGLPEPMAGAGMRDAEAWEYAAANGPDTAAILYVAGPHAMIGLPGIVTVARTHGIPVIVDAAAELPPASNLRRFIEEGADLVVFSGGKILGGPAGTGILCGRRDLIMSATLQTLDMDVEFESWQPPLDFIDKSLLPGLPRQGIGRSCKTGKHEVFGLLAALDHFLNEGDAARHARWRAVCRNIRDGIGALGLFDVTLAGEEDCAAVPHVALRFKTPSQADAFNRQLLSRDTPVHLGRDPFCRERLLVNPTCLRAHEIAPLVQAIVASSASIGQSDA